MQTIFLHGLESSSRGTKAQWFKENYPAVWVPDFTGTLMERLAQLNSILAEESELMLIGSSFGGLMATIYAMENESRVSGLVLLAPALNFPDFKAYSVKELKIPVRLYIGVDDDVCPPDIVVPIARRICANISVQISEDDHLLRKTFTTIDWMEIFKE